MLASLVLGHHIALVFNHFDLGASRFLGVLTLDGESNWFEGGELLAFHATIAIIYGFMHQAFGSLAVGDRHL